MIGISDFVFERDDNGLPQAVACPHGQTASVEPTRTPGRFRADFDAEACASCLLLDHCPTRGLKRQSTIRCLRFDQQQVNVAYRHANRRKLKDQPHNLRSAVEATVRSIKHPFGNGKLPVRGHPRMSMMMVASAVMVNIRRIWRNTTAPDPAQPAIAAHIVDDLVQTIQLVVTFLNSRLSVAQVFL